MRKPEVLFHIQINDPISKFVKPYKKPKIDQDNGKEVSEKVYYLNNNIFFGNSIHWATQYEIINFAKDWLMPFLMEVPKIEKCKIEIVYHHHKTNWDLDNKGAFWMKILLDLLKTPNQGQLDKADKYNNYVRSVDSLPDDTVQHVNGYKVDFERGAHCLEIKIIGYKQQFKKQETLFQ